MTAAKYYESTIGTVRYLLLFVVTNLLIQLIFTLLMALCSLGTLSSMYFKMYGLFPLLLAGLVVECNKEPDLKKQ